MSWTEILGFVTGAICVWLTVRRNIWNFPVGIANNVFFFVLFLQTGLYADAWLQVVYLGLAALGWYWWLRGGVDHTALVVRRTPAWAWAAVLAAVGAATAVLWRVLTSNTDSTVPVWDAVTTALSLGAQLMLNRKWIGHWWLWITADVLYIALYWHKGLHLTSALYVLFLAMCVVGLVQWRRALSAPTDVEVTKAAPEVVIHDLLDAPVDAVFTSDAYGAELGRRLDAAWVRVDPGRVATPVSGTAVRTDVPGHWWALSPTVRADLARRVVVLGAESTGSTTLARHLAARLGCPWVPEFGRTWSGVRPGGLDAQWHPAEFELIAVEHQRQEVEALRSTPVPVVVSDTDVLATCLWFERYVGGRLESLWERAEAWRPDLYVLTGDEIPIVQDGMRDGEHIRHAMQERFRQVLTGWGVEWIEVRGSEPARLAQAYAAVGALLGRGWQLAPPLG
ncbi:nicotinamide riboside transporter PnuC [Mariniluteicoccus flavus]